MALEVRLGSETLYKSSFPICHARRSSPYSQGQKARVEFSFRPSRSINWQGYRDEDDKQAGADPDQLLIGVTFSDTRAIYMNTIHIAKPTERSQSEVAEGLTIVTYPADGGG